MSGWQCSGCGWHTADLEVVKATLWRTARGILDPVCPDCGEIGSLIDWEPPKAALGQVERDMQPGEAGGPGGRS